MEKSNNNNNKQAKVFGRFSVRQSNWCLSANRMIVFGMVTMNMNRTQHKTYSVIFNVDHLERVGKPGVGPCEGIFLLHMFEIAQTLVSPAVIIVARLLVHTFKDQTRLDCETIRTDPKRAKHE